MVENLVETFISLSCQMRFNTGQIHFNGLCQIRPPLCYLHVPRTLLEQYYHGLFDEVAYVSDLEVNRSQ